MDQRYGGGAFADRAAHAFHRAGAHVADCEHAGHCRFEWGGRTPRGQACRRRTRQHKAVFVEFDATAFKPTRLGVRTHEQEHMSDRAFLFDTRLLVAPSYRGEAFHPIAVELRELRVRSLLDVRRGVDAVDQIA